MMAELLFTVEWTEQIRSSTCLGPGIDPLQLKKRKVVRGTPLQLVFPDGSKIKVEVKRYPKQSKTAPITLRENYVVPSGTQVWLDDKK